MLARFLNNWPYKLAAILIAIALHKYVSAQLNPTTVTQLPAIPLYATPVPPGYVVTDIPQTVTAQLSGPANVLDNLHESDHRISARVSLAGAKNGINPNLPVTVALPADLSDQVTVDSVSPADVSVTIDPLEKISMGVRVSFARLAPAGYIYKTPVVDPVSATVSGPATQLKEVHELVAYADTSNDTQAPSTLQGTFSLIPLDEHGAEVQGVSVDPPMAHVTIPIARTSAVKALVVSPVIAGSPAYPWSIVSVTVQPEMVTVSGPASALANTSMASTAPIDVTGLAGEVRREIDLQLGPGITPLSSTHVSVVVKMARRPTVPSVPAVGGPTR